MSLYGQGWPRTCYVDLKFSSAGTTGMDHYCVCVYVGLGMYVHVCGGQRSTLGMVPQEMSTLFSEALACVISRGWLASPRDPLSPLLQLAS